MPNFHLLYLLHLYLILWVKKTGIFTNRLYWLDMLLFVVEKGGVTLVNTTTPAVPQIDFSKVPLEQLDELVERAREYKRRRQTNPVLVKGYVDSVRKHRNALLTAVGKLMKAEGVSKQRWKELDDIMQTLSMDRYKDEAQKLGQKASKK
jgi:hypothetical protein